MAEDDKPNLGDVYARAISENPAPARVFPDVHFPIAYADGVMSVSLGTEVVKFYLSRINPNVTGQGGDQQIPVAQIVMPKAGFTVTAFFFLQQLKRLVDGPPSLPDGFLDLLRNECAEIVEAVNAKRQQ